MFKLHKQMISSAFTISNRWPFSLQKKLTKDFLEREDYNFTQWHYKKTHFFPQTFPQPYTHKFKKTINDKRRQRRRLLPPNMYKKYL